MPNIEWETPQDFFDALNDEFHFNIDVCATNQNAKCKKFYSVDDDSLSMPWYGKCWMNPITCFVHPNVLNLIYEKENLCSLQNRTIINAKIFPSQTDIKRWLALCVQRMQPQDGTGISSEKAIRSFPKKKTSSGKEEIFNIREGLIEEAKIQRNIQSSQEAEEYFSSMGLDITRLGKLQKSMEPYMRILWFFWYKINSRSFYPFILSRLSRNSEIKYDTSLSELQHQQATLKTGKLVQRQGSACKNCGLSECIPLGSIWLNPPYNKNIGRWVGKAYESAQEGTTVICLLPGRSGDTKWWHEYVMRSSEIRFIKGRLQFLKEGKCGSGSNISSVVVVFRPYCQGPPVVSSIDTAGKLFTRG